LSTKSTIFFSFRCENNKKCDWKLIYQKIRLENKQFLWANINDFSFHMLNNNLVSIMPWSNWQNFFVQKDKPFMIFSLYIRPSLSNMLTQLLNSTFFIFLKDQDHTKSFLQKKSKTQLIQRKGIFLLLLKKKIRENIFHSNGETLRDTKNVFDLHYFKSYIIFRSWKTFLQLSLNKKILKAHFCKRLKQFRNFSRD